jgi:hypothetical protein
MRRHFPPICIAWLDCKPSAQGPLPPQLEHQTAQGPTHARCLFSCSERGPIKSVRSGLTCHADTAYAGLVKEHGQGKPERTREHAERMRASTTADWSIRPWALWCRQSTASALEAAAASLWVPERSMSRSASTAPACTICKRMLSSNAASCATRADARSATVLPPSSACLPPCQSSNQCHARYQQECDSHPPQHVRTTRSP